MVVVLPPLLLLLFAPAGQRRLAAMLAIAYLAAWATMFIVPLRVQRSRAPHLRLSTDIGTADTPGTEEIPPEVAGLFAAVPTLSSEAWARIEKTFQPPSESLLGSFLRGRRRSKLLRRVLGAPGADDLLRRYRSAARAVQRWAASGVVPFPNGEGALLMAVLALVFRDNLSSSEFRDLYSPFEPLLPASRLVDDSA